MKKYTHHIHPRCQLCDIILHKSKRKPRDGSGKIEYCRTCIYALQSMGADPEKELRKIKRGD